MVFVCFPERRFPLAALDAPRMLRDAAAAGAHVVVLDSLAAAYMGPLLALRGVGRASGNPAPPVVGLLHQVPGGLVGGRPRRAIQRTLDRLAYRYATRLFVVSDLLRDQLLRDGVAAERIVVVRPGCDLAAARAYASLGPADSTSMRGGRRIAVLCVANWLPHKGIAELLEAVARLPDDHVTLHLAGDEQVDPGYGERVRARALRADVAGRVVRHGKLPPEDVGALYAGADVFALPSFGETYGMVYAEAMTHGLPVAGWRAGNLPNLVEHGREGLLAEPGDVAALADALARLARDDALRARMSAAARKRASAWPTWDETAATFFAALREVVARAVAS